METNGLRARKYSAIKNALFAFGLFINIGLLAFVQCSGISNSLRIYASGISGAFYITNALYATFLGGILYLAGLPLSFYKGYALEHRFGLSNQGLASWLKDELKKAGISYIIFLVFVEFLYLFLRNFPGSWWAWIAGTWILFGIVFAKIVPVLIIPLFFRYTELKNDKLEAKLIRLAQSCGVKVLDVFKLDLSRKTKKANAAFTGIGNTRRILLSDTLLKNYNDDEIEVVIAHELAHYKFRHIWRTLVFGGLFTIAGFYLIKVAMVSLAPYLGLEAIYDIAALPSILLLLTVFGLASLPAENWYSRGLEKKADLFAIKITGMADAFISCMKKLARQNLANVSPSKFIEIMLYNHPPISKRIRMADNILKGEGGARE